MMCHTFGKRKKSPHAFKLLACSTCFLAVLAPRCFFFADDWFAVSALISLSSTPHSRNYKGWVQAFGAIASESKRG